MSFSTKSVAMRIVLEFKRCLGHDETFGGAAALYSSWTSSIQHGWRQVDGVDDRDACRSSRCSPQCNTCPRLTAHRGIFAPTRMADYTQHARYLCPPYTCLPCRRADYCLRNHQPSRNTPIEHRRSAQPPDVVMIAYFSPRDCGSHPPIVAVPVQEWETRDLSAAAAMHSFKLKTYPSRQ